MRRTHIASVFALLTLVVPAMLAAQRAGPELRCRNNDRWDDDDNVRHCEIREKTIPASSRLDVDATPNGSIRVHGADRTDVRMVARVESWARTDDDAKALASKVTIASDGGRIRSDGPETRRRENWSVSYELWVPRQSNLDLRSYNGGVSVDVVDGNMELRTMNGGLTLDDLAGDVRGETTNGGLHVFLTGDRWRGAGLDLRTTNGGVDMEVPKGYSATLETGTVNGGFHFDFPITVQGSLNRRQFTTRLGSGGPTIRATTTNGGVTIRER